MSELDRALSDLVDGVPSAGSGALEEHIIIGRDRVIIVPESLKKIAVQYDHNVETVTFDCPRYWDEVDMSTMNVYIAYMRPDGQVSKDIATNVVVDGEDENIMHFDWTIKRHATEVKGFLSILVCINSVNDEGKLVHDWNSELSKEDLYISEGLDCGDSILIEYPDIVTELLTKMTANETAINILTDRLNDVIDGTHATNADHALLADEAVSVRQRNVWKITSIDTIYDDISSLPTEGVENGNVFVAKTNGEAPYCMYSWDADKGEWVYIDDVRGKTIYIVQKSDYFEDCLYHFKTCDMSFHKLWISDETLISDISKVYSSVGELNNTTIPGVFDRYAVPAIDGDGNVRRYIYNGDTKQWASSTLITNQRVYVDLKTDTLHRYIPGQKTFRALGVKHADTVDPAQIPLVANVTYSYDNLLKWYKENKDEDFDFIPHKDDQGNWVYPLVPCEHGLAVFNCNREPIKGDEFTIISVISKNGGDEVFRLICEINEKGTAVGGGATYSYYIKDYTLLSGRADTADEATHATNADEADNALSVNDIVIGKNSENNIYFREKNGPTTYKVETADHANTADEATNAQKVNDIKLGVFGGDTLGFAHDDSNFYYEEFMPAIKSRWRYEYDSEHKFHILTRVEQVESLRRGDIIRIFAEIPAVVGSYGTVNVTLTYTLSKDGMSNGSFWTASPIQYRGTNAITVIYPPELSLADMDLGGIRITSDISSALTEKITLNADGSFKERAFSNSAEYFTIKDIQFIRCSTTVDV